MSVKFFDTDEAYAVDKNLKKNAVKALIKWVDSQQHLPKINEAQAILFLQRWNYQTEVAQNAVDSYFTFKTLCSDMFSNRNPVKLPLTDLGVFCITVLPKKTPEGYHIIYLKLINTDVNDFDFAVQLKYFDMFITLHLHQQHSSLDYIIITDMNDLSLEHMEKFETVKVKKFFYYMQEIIPLNLKGLHYFNIPSYYDHWLSIFEHYLENQLANLIYGHKTVEDLVKYVPRECLPKDYGGPLDSLSVVLGKMKDTLLKNSAFFEWQDTQIVDERKRSAKSKILENMVAVVGTSQNGLFSDFASVDSEYAKDPKLKQNDVQELLDWTHNQPHLPKITELQAILFLKKEQYQKETAKDAIDSYFTYKTLHSDVFLKRNPFNTPLKENIDKFLFTVLPKETPEGYRIIFVKILDNLDDVSLETHLKHIDMFLTSNLYQNGSTKGFILLMDVEDMSFGLIQKHSPHLVKVILYYFQHTGLAEVKELHYFNLVPQFKEYLSIIKPFFPRLYWYNSLADLTKHIPKECLPKNYGGPLESVSVLHEKTKTNFFNSAALFDWEDTQTVNESKRPKDSKTLENFLEIFESIHKGQNLTFADVESEYGKNKNLKRDEVIKLIEWVHNQPHLPEINEIQAIVFLQKWQYQTEDAKNAIDSYFTYKTFNADIFSGRNPLNSSVKDALEACVVTVLPKKTPEGYSIVFGKLLNVDYYDLAEQVKHADMVISLNIYQEGPSNGYLFAIDIKNFPEEILSKFVPFTIKRFFHYFREVVPIQLKGVHFFNTVPFMNRFKDVVYDAVKEESEQWLHYHKDVEELTKYIPKDCLPNDYGGSVGSTLVLKEITKNKLLANAALFEWEDTQTVDENKRPHQHKTLRDILAILGSAPHELIGLGKHESEYAKDKRLKKHDVKELIDWVHYQSHLPEINEIQAIRFLQRWQYQVEVGKNSIDSYFTYKTFSSELFLGRNPSVSPLKESLDVFLFTVLPKKTPEGYNIIFAKMLDHSGADFDFSVQIKHVDMVSTLHLYQEGSSKNYIVVFDFRNFASAVSKLDPVNMKKHFHYIQEVAPMQWKAIHVINPDVFVNDLVNAIKPSLESELLDNLFIHNEIDDLLKYVPKDCLPKDYGGSAHTVTILHDKTKKNILANAAFFDWEDKQTTVEHLRSDSYKPMKDILAIVHPSQNGNAVNGQNGSLADNGSYM